MRRTEALAIISRHAAELHAMGVRTLSLFGSVARDDATPASDVDVLVEFDRPVGYFHMFEVQERLESLLGRRVDLVTPGGLRPELKQGAHRAIHRGPRPCPPLEPTVVHGRIYPRSLVPP